MMVDFETYSKALALPGSCASARSCLRCFLGRFHPPKKKFGGVNLNSWDSFSQKTWFSKSKLQQVGVTTSRPSTRLVSC